MAKKQDVKTNDACKHTQAKERIIEEKSKQYKQNYCPSCERVLRSELNVEVKEGDE